MEYSALIRGQKTKLCLMENPDTLSLLLSRLFSLHLYFYIIHRVIPAVLSCCCDFFFFFRQVCFINVFLKGLISVVPQVVSESWAALLQRWTMCAKCASAHRVEHVGCNKYHIIIYSRLIILQIGAGDVYTNSPERIQLNVRITKMSVIQLYSHIFDS